MVAHSAHLRILLALFGAASVSGGVYGSKGSVQAILKGHMDIEDLGEGCWQLECKSLL